MRWNFWFVFGILWALLGTFDIVTSWETGKPRDVPDALLYAMVSFILGYVTEGRKEKK